MQKCEKCSFETGSIIGLARHLKQKHGMILGTSKNTCSYCKKVFTTTTGCKRHIEKKICIPKDPEPDPVPIVPAPIPLADPDPEIIPLVLQSFPVEIETEKQKPRSLVSTLVKVVICSVLFIPFFLKDTKDISL